MSTAAPVVTNPEGQPPLSEGERLIDVFIAPRKTFADIRRSAMWLAPFIVMALFSVAYSYTVSKKVGWEQVAQNNTRMAPASQTARLEALPPDQRAIAERRQVTVTKFIGYGFSVLNLIWLLIVALVLWGTFNFGAGAEMRFGQAFAILVYASLVGIVRTTLGIITLFAGQDPENFLIQNPVGTNLGYYLNFADTPRFLYSIASSFDLVLIWTLVLTAIGFATVGKVKQGTAMTIVFGWFIVFAVVSAGLAAAFA
jgi:hypothetical protein